MTSGPTHSVTDKTARISVGYWKIPTVQINDKWISTLANVINRCIPTVIVLCTRDSKDNLKFALSLQNSLESNYPFVPWKLHHYLSKRHEKTKYYLIINKSNMFLCTDFKFMNVPSCQDNSHALFFAIYQKELKTSKIYVMVVEFPFKMSSRLIFMDSCVNIINKFRSRSETLVMIGNFRNALIERMPSVYDSIETLSNPRIFQHDTMKVWIDPDIPTKITNRSGLQVTSHLNIITSKYHDVCPRIIFNPLIMDICTELIQLRFSRNIMTEEDYYDQQHNIRTRMESILKTTSMLSSYMMVFFYIQF